MLQVDSQLRSQCPPSDILTDWQRGTLSAHLAEDVQRHLAECDRCLDLLDADDADEPTDDPLLVALRAQPSCPDDEPEFQRLQETLLAEPPTTLGRSLAATLLWTEGPATSAGGRLPTLAELPYAFGNYELLAPIGRGSFGVVYRARHVRLNQTVAVKLLDAASCGGPAAVEDFLREMQAVGSLLHPAIIRATDAGQCAGLHYLVMEYVEGLDAARLLRQHGPWGPAEACEIVRQAAWGLDFAHRQGLVHRDVKPANLLVSSAGEVKLLDLGLAYRPDGAPRAAGRQTPLGTAEYMAPEQWQRSWQVDAKADLYSLGCTLFRLTTGQLPYARALAAGSSWQQCHCSEEPDWAPLASAAGHPAMLELCRSLLAKDPAQRPASAAEVAERLREAAAPHRLSEWLVACGVATPKSTAPPAESPIATLPAASSEASACPPSAKKISGWSRRRWLVAASCGLAGVAWGLRHRWFRPILSSDWRDLAPAGVPLPFSESAVPRGGWRLSVAAPTGSTAVHLLTLGRPLVAPFRLAAHLQTTSPAAGGGLFFQWRYHPTDQKATFQSVELRPRLAGESPRLLWSGWEVQFGPAASRATRTPWAEATAPAASGLHHEVELALGVQGFPQIVWNGRRFDESLWTFSEEGRNARSAASQRSPWSALGRLGLLHAAGELEFWSPRLAYAPEAVAGRASL